MFDVSGDISNSKRRKGHYDGSLLIKWNRGETNVWFIWIYIRCVTRSGGLGAMESKKSVGKITGDHLWTRFLSEDNEAHNVNTGYSGAHKSASSTDASCSGRQSALNASAWPRKRELFREFLVFQRKAAPLYRHITDHMTTPHQFCARYLSNFVSTGCPAIDAAMGGGFRKGVLSEVST